MKECDKLFDLSHSFIRHIAFFHSTIRILLNFHRNVFSPHSEGTVEPIIYDNLHAKTCGREETLLFWLVKQCNK